ncbi:MAG: DUF433 domain-containing protein [Euryarchaeota archaeon]|nr:DUF433 domain-containing protein [Euryarchaeota archaeon]MBU4222047.1 DUF433 domain-containing protein [Euryarchaeota archaeon]MCG2738091.1 DUF433 domain-containing protein [Candidatus Methanoperedenaceae archaeon]
MFEERIVIDPEIRHGKPIIKGTRVPVEVILGSLAGGMEIREIASEYGIIEELIIEYHRKGYSISMIAEKIDVPIAKVMDVLSRLDEETEIEKTLEEIEIGSSDNI